MKLNHYHKFVYISTPKVATFTIGEILKTHYSRGLEDCGLHINQIPTSCAEYFRWTICRNPYTRAVSLWWSGCRLHPPDIYGFRKGCSATDNFAQFIDWLSRTKLEDRHELMRNQTDWLRPCQPITAIHIESLAESIKMLPFWKQNIILPHMNTTEEKIIAQSSIEGTMITRPHWKELYKDNNAKESVLRWASEDFITFGYSTELEDYSQ